MPAVRDRCGVNAAATAALTVTTERGGQAASASRGAVRASCGPWHPGAWALPGTWRGCVGSRGASSGGAPRGAVAGGRVRGCTVIFGSTELWAGQTPGPGAAMREEAVRPQPHLRVLNGGSFRPPLASRPGVAGTRQPSRAAHRLPRRPRPPEGRAPGTRRCRTPLAPLTPSATFAGHTPCARDHRRPRGH